MSIPIDIIEKKMEIEREREKERFIMQEVLVRSAIGFLTLFIGFIDFRLSPSNATFLG